MDETVSIPCDCLIARRAALAFAIVSRRVADDVGAFKSSDVDPADLEGIWDDAFECVEEFGQGSIDSFDTVGYIFLVPAVALPPDLSLGFGCGLANAPWTEGRC